VIIYNENKMKSKSKKREDKNSKSKKLSNKFLTEIKKFYKKEIKEFKNLFNPFFILKLLYKYRYIHFFLTGISGVLINLFLTWFFTYFIFGLRNYFYGYLIGLTANLIYNFTLHVHINFKVKTKWKQRFVIFIIYSLIMSFVQATIIKFITPIIGLRYYLLVIATVIFVFSIFNFVIFKLWLFKDKKR